MKWNIICIVSLLTCSKYKHNREWGIIKQTATHSFCCCLVTKLCPTLCNSMDWSPPGSSGNGIIPARLLEWVAISFSRGSSWPRYWTCVSCIGRLILYQWATWEASQVVLVIKNPSANAGDTKHPASIPGSGRSPGAGHGNPLQYSCLENSMDRGAWWATVHWVAKNQTRLKWLSTHAQQPQKQI